LHSRSIVQSPVTPAVLCGVGGVAGRRTRGELVKRGSTFQPPTVHHNPFLSPALSDPALRPLPARRGSVAPLATAAAEAAAAAAASLDLVASALDALNVAPRDLGPIASVRPPSIDSNLSDWSDCDSAEFPAMHVRSDPLLCCHMFLNPSWCPYFPVHRAVTQALRQLLHMRAIVVKAGAVPNACCRRCR
jgi:hypothetical protein